MQSRDNMKKEGFLQDKYRIFLLLLQWIKLKKQKTTMNLQEKKEKEEIVKC